MFLASALIRERHLQIYKQSSVDNIHRDYKRTEAASGDESRDKLNKANGSKFKSRMYSDEKHTVFVFLLVFMTMIRTNIDYNGKIVL